MDKFVRLLVWDYIFMLSYFAARMLYLQVRIWIIDWALKSSKKEVTR